MHFILLNDWHITGREKQDTGAEIWRIIVDIDGLEELEEDARMIVILVVVMMLMIGSRMMIMMMMMIRTTLRLSSRTLKFMVASKEELVCGLRHDAEYPH